MKPFDGTHLFVEHEKRLERDRMTYKKDRFWHRSRGGKKLLEEIEDVIKAGLDTDYRWDGEDEYSVETVDFGVSAKAMIRFLAKKGLLKKLL